MESHSYEAARHGFDVIWWTDHGSLFWPYEDIRVDFRYARQGRSGEAVVFRRGMRRQFTRLNVSRTGPGCRVVVEQGRVTATVESGPDGEPARISLSPGSARGKVHLVDFCRPVGTGLVFEIWGALDGLGRDSYFRLDFDFSLHPHGCHHAVFEAEPGAPGGVVTVGDTLARHRIDLRDGDFHLALNLEDALSSLPHGDDNTLSACRIEIGTRRGAKMMLHLDSLAIRSLESDGESRYRAVKALADRYERRYGVKQIIGVEYGLLHTPERPHMNAYFPEGAPAFGSVSMKTSIGRRAWVDEVHELGGLVSLDHPFGTGWGGGGGEGQYDPHQVSYRKIMEYCEPVGEGEFREVAGPILDGSLVPDLLEVGYLYRGRASLEDHLRLWDLALANGVRIVGFGSSDSHGGRWGPEMLPNPFASWIWAESDGPDDLLEGLRAGHLAFGDPFFWKSDFAFGVEGAMMGDTLLVGPGDAPEAWLEIEPWRDDVEVRLIQVAISKDSRVEVLAEETLGPWRRGRPLSVEVPCYARVEIYEPDGTPLVFSNPVYLMPR
jgi:hypothetical protein